MPYEQRFAQAEASEVRCPDQEASERMQQRIREIMLAKDTLGGVIEVVALGVPAGLGSYVHWERRLEARLGAALLSVPAIKGVEVGPAFHNARLPGTQAQDPIVLEGEELRRPTALSGGLEGGITTGGAAGAAGGDEADRHHADPTSDGGPGDGRAERPPATSARISVPVPRAVVVLEAMTAFVLAEALLEKLGGDSMEEIRPRLAALRKARLSDLVMDNQEHVYWPEEGTQEA